MKTQKKFIQQLCLTLAGFLLLNATAQAQYVFTTIDDPVAAATNGGTTFVTGINGNTIVGYYFSPLLHGFYHVLGTTNYTTLDEPLGFVNGSSSTEAFGISGGNIVGYYQNNTGGAAGFYGFMYNIGTSNYLTLDHPSGDFQGQSRTMPRAIDGTNIVGDVDVNVPIFLAYGGGFEAQFTGSGFVYGTPFYYPSVQRVTGNTTNYATFIFGISGSNAVGYYSDESATFHGFILNLASSDLNNPSNYTAFNSPTGGGCPVTGIDGNNIVGYYADPNHSFNYSGFVYNMASGQFTATSIRDPFSPQNTFVQGISGSTIVGYYLDNSAVTHGFVATIPTPVVDLVIIGNQMVFTATNGFPGASSLLIKTTDLTLPRSQWSMVSSNTFNSSGSFSFTNTVVPSGTATFFELRGVH